MLIRETVLVTSLILGGIISFPISLLAQNTWQNQTDCQGEKILSALNCNGDNLDSEEEKLYQLINRYRQQQGLTPVGFSSSLTRLANRHLRDLLENVQLYSRTGKYWRFGWSDCPYDAGNPSTFSCMWTAPQRLKTVYTGRGYEIICGGVGQITAEDALDCWQKSPLNNEVILNQGNWQNDRWQAIGVGIEQGYAVVWFGQEPDLDQKNPSRPRGGRIW